MLYGLECSKETKSMDLAFLESLVNVVESGSIAEAARMQQLTGAAVRQRVAALERELGVTLLTRAGHTCVPTQPCLSLLQRARSLVHDGKLLREDLDATGLAGPLRIGAISTVLTGLMPGVLHALAEQAPRVTPLLNPGGSAALYEAVLSGELDAAVIVAPPFALPKSMATAFLRREPLLFITKQATGRTIKDQLSGERYIRYDAAAWGGRFAQQYLLAQGVQPQLFCNLDALEAITLMVAAGVGVSLIPQWMGFEELRARVHSKVIAGKQYQRELVLIARRHVAQTERMRLLLSLLNK